MIYKFTLKQLVIIENSLMNKFHDINDVWADSHYSGARKELLDDLNDFLVSIEETRNIVKHMIEEKRNEETEL